MDNTIKNSTRTNYICSKLNGEMQCDNSFTELDFDLKKTSTKVIFENDKKVPHFSEWNSQANYCSMACQRDSLCNGVKSTYSTNDRSCEFYNTSVYSKISDTKVITLDSDTIIGAKTIIKNSAPIDLPSVSDNASASFCFKINGRVACRGNNDTWGKIDYNFKNKSNKVTYNKSDNTSRFITEGQQIQYCAIMCDRDSQCTGIKSNYTPNNYSCDYYNTNFST